jgi:DNA-binding response OmpR family regulator
MYHIIKGLTRMTKILIVDDDRHIAELMSLYLKKEGYDTCEVYSGSSAVPEFMRYQPDLVVLDLMLPGMDGYDVCRHIRKTGNTPIVMLTAKGETFDKVLGLELGADDYIVKPFEPKEFLARVKAILRRSEMRHGSGQDDEAGKIISMPHLTINPVTYQVTYHGTVLELPPKEFELLYFLASNPGNVYTRNQLLNRVWGYDYLGDSRTIDVHIKRLREKIYDSGGIAIKTVYGVGYKFEISNV